MNDYIPDSTVMTVDFAKAPAQHLEQDAIDGEAIFNQPPLPLWTEPKPLVEKVAPHRTRWQRCPQKYVRP